MKRKSLAEILVLLLFLLGLPLGSWYYLKRGFEYRLAALSELSERGRLPDFQGMTIEGAPVDVGALSGNVVVAGIAPTGDEALLREYSDHLTMLRKQFSSHNDLLFLIHLADTSAQALAALREAMSAKELRDAERVRFVSHSDPPAALLGESGYGLPAPPGGDWSRGAQLLLADTSGIIRNYYDISLLEDRRKLVEHLAIVLPRKKDRDLVFRRENER
jgi:hypothetical protein